MVCLSKPKIILSKMNVLISLTQQRFFMKTETGLELKYELQTEKKTHNPRKLT